ncbi:DNA-binding transcriptional activator PunR [Ferrimonas senticii]|uniref:DNA-binding transcriptional activator PunR n=1 Tax=Ferrimonas senticii TaxID=394566 RepID=UPI00041F2D61|nr:DNA-binding transcriptional activator PunR [Ferrimonas senticii]
MFDKATLQMLDTVARAGSFSAAAKQLHKVPSAISYSVRQVEQQLGAELFQRLPKKVVLTPAGEHFVNQARLWLREMAEVQRQTQRVAKGWQAQLRVALDSIVKPAPVTELIADFYQQFDDAELLIHFEVFNGVWDALADGRADLAIGATAAIPVGGDFGFRPMGSLSWVLVCAPQHPAATLDSISPQALQNIDTICLEDTSRSLPKRDNWLQGPKRRIMVPDWSNAISCLQQGLGIGNVPQHLAQPLLASGQLVALTSEPSKPDSACGIAWRRSSEGPLLSWLLDYLGEAPQTQQRWLAPEPMPATLHLP